AAVAARDGPAQRQEDQGERQRQSREKRCDERLLTLRERRATGERLAQRDAVEEERAVVGRRRLPTAGRECGRERSAPSDRVVRQLETVRRREGADGRDARLVELLGAHE